MKREKMKIDVFFRKLNMTLNPAQKFMTNWLKVGLMDLETKKIFSHFFKEICTQKLILLKNRNFSSVYSHLLSYKRF